MKKAIKYLIKLLFVIIIPLLAILMTYFEYEYLQTMNSIASVIYILIIIGIFLNVYIFSNLMHTVKLLPDINCQFIPLIGFGAGYDLDGGKIIILIPFCAIEIWIKKK
jgi:hypothetical protein